MTDKEIGELRRHLRSDRCAVEAVYGCLVNDKKEIACNFRQSLAMIPKDDAEAVLALMRKTLSGIPGKNILTVPFSTEQVMDSPEHRMFSALRHPGEVGDAAVQTLFEQTAAALQMGGNYLLLLIRDAYDVPAANREEDGTEVFAYCVCAVCPVKETKAALGFFPSENALRELTQNSVIAPPEVGFVFPSFDDRTANIYDLTYYTKRSAANHPEFLEEVARITAPMPADEQKESFNGVLEQSLSENCSLKIAVAVHDTLCEQLDAAKEEPEEAQPTVTKGGVSRILRDNGVTEPEVEKFEAAFDEAFGENAALPPQNLVNRKQIEVVTPDVQIRINPDRSDLLDTRIIDGVHYILIRAENGVEVNGVNLRVD